MQMPYAPVFKSPNLATEVSFINSALLSQYKNSYKKYNAKEICLYVSKESVIVGKRALFRQKTHEGCWVLLQKKKQV